MNEEGLAAWLGPQYGNDDAFTARMRAHQSWWRAAVLGEPCGVGPHESSTHRYGNFLPAEAAERGGNFLTGWVWDVVTERLSEGGGVERYRCLHNLLSSQPMCFNLFGRLRHRPDVATRLFAALLPDEVGEVEEVAIEWAPTPKDQYLDDATSFDAFVRYRRAQSGDLAFLAVETKLTEPFSQKHYSLDHRPAYRQLTEHRDSPWKPETLHRVTEVAWNQLWRNHLLATALVDDASAPYVFGLPVVVHHPDDEPAIETMEGYRDLLHDPSAVRVFDLGQIVDAWRPALESDADRDWIDAFNARYLQLDLSRQAFTQLQAAG